MVVQPPPILVRMGLVGSGSLWKLKKTLYGISCDPKRWSQKRGQVLHDHPAAL